MRRRRFRGESFLLVIIDDDNHRFTIEGPMTDADPWIREVIAGRRSGRQISCTVFTGSIDDARRFGESAGQRILWPAGTIVAPR